jgi:hypothetical protein
MAPNPPPVSPVSLLDKAARRLAQAITDEVTASRLTEYPAELEGIVAALELAAPAKVGPAGGSICWESRVVSAFLER